MEKPSSTYHAPFTVCPACDLVLAAVTVHKDNALVCPRCRQLLHRYKHNSVVKTFALSLTALLLYVPAISLPLMSMGILGISSSGSLVTAVYTMFLQHQYFAGLIVFLTTILFPLATLTTLCKVSFGLLTGKKFKWMPRFFRHYLHLTEWAMADVFLIAIFITMIKMAHTANIELKLGFYCFAGLVVIGIAAQSAVDRQLFWSLMDKGDNGDESYNSVNHYTDITGELLTCRSCRKTISVRASETAPKKCPRCGDAIPRRKANSISHTLAFLLTAVILTFPANLLPIMEVSYFGIPDRSTIMDGIVYFFQDGSYGIGFIILTASILVPMFKIIGLSIILLTIHFKWKVGLKRKAVMFRFIEFIGRWSMLDIFVIALLCTLVQFGFFSTIQTAPAAFYFTGVVISTMLAATTFDPRLLWDSNSST